VAGLPPASRYGNVRAYSRPASFLGFLIAAKSTATHVKHVTRVRARYGETDQAGVVYHATFLSWFEVGRTELLRETGQSYADFERERALRLTVVEAHLNYHVPGRYDELVRIESWIEGLRRVRFTVRHRISSEERGCVLATGFIGLACVAFDGRICAIPEDVRVALVRFADSDDGGKESPERIVTTRHGGTPA
jgi:acyl-CoA thioester hydrolase